MTGSLLYCLKYCDEIYRIDEGESPGKFNWPDDFVFFREGPVFGGYSVQAGLLVFAGTNEVEDVIDCFNASRS